MHFINFNAFTSERFDIGKSQPKTGQKKGKKCLSKRDENTERENDWNADQAIHFKINNYTITIYIITAVE